MIYYDYIVMKINEGIIYSYGKILEIKCKDRVYIIKYIIKEIVF